ncbi:hypothetical protein GD1_82 [Paraglaciecola Antarctic GD virus 1]|nr:hypothetical protein GD1_82 [Paraglaciecola Antarctic GD virus 1]
MKSAQLIELYRNPHMVKFYEGDLVDDTIEELYKVQRAEMALEDTSKEQMFDLISNEDELACIQDILVDSLKMNKKEMIQQIKYALTQLQEKDQEFCDRKTSAQRLIGDDNV